MKTISRRSAIRAIGILPAAGMAGTLPAVAEAGQGRLPSHPDDLRSLAEWHYGELLRLLDALPAGELHVVLQRIRGTET